MAVLSDTIRNRIHAALMRGPLLLWPGLKSDLRAAVNAADDWLDSNATSYNNALPQPFRGTATTAQKALLLSIVALARYDIQFLKNIVEDN